jgi:hypothetical protein
MHYGKELHSVFRSKGPLNKMSSTKLHVSKFHTLSLIYDLHYYYYYYYGSTALCWTLAAFQSLNHIHIWYDSLDGGSARRKAFTYTQDNTNTE